MPKPCVLCGEKGEETYGYIICDQCKSKLGLLTDDTIKKHVSSYRKSKNQSYEDEINYRLDFIEKDYIKKRIKLLHIQNRLKYLDTP